MPDEEMTEGIFLEPINLTQDIAKRIERTRSTFYLMFTWLNIMAIVKTLYLTAIIIYIKKKSSTHYFVWYLPKSK